MLEFIAAFIGCSRIQNERFIKEQFNKLDADGSGKISKDELMSIFHTDTIAINDIDIKALIS
jgi:calcium-dependent protein kinase